jgi:hypothetical protein
MLLPWIKVDSLIPIILPNLNPILHLLALGTHHILHVGRIRVNEHILAYVFGCDSSFGTLDLWLL